MADAGSDLSWSRPAHPAVEEQVAEVTQVLSAVTEPNVAILCESLGLQLLAFDFLPEGHPGCTFGDHEGCTARPFNVNPNWALSVNQHGITRPLILQVSNPHAWRKSRNTESKVAAMRFLKGEGIPLIPEVLGWSSDTETSHLGAEYILMERVPGVELQSVWESASEEERQAYVKQIAEWLHAVGALSCPGGRLEQVSGFRVQRDGIATGVEWAVNGPPLPLRDGFAEFALGALDDVVARIQEDSASGWEVDRQDMLPGLAEARAFILHYKAKYEATPAAMLDSCADFGVCHGDLHPGNVMCDPDTGRLTGIIDWENVSWGPREPDLCVPWLGTGKGNHEREIICNLLAELRFLHFFTVTWWGHCITMEKKLQAHADEARNCAADARKALDSFLALSRPLLERTTT